MHDVTLELYLATLHPFLSVQFLVPLMLISTRDTFIVITI